MVIKVDNREMLSGLVVRFKNIYPNSEVNHVIWNLSQRAIRRSFAVVCRLCDRRALCFFKNKLPIDLFRWSEYRLH